MYLQIPRRETSIHGVQDRATNIRNRLEEQGFE